MATKESVTGTGWYENTDGTWGLYTWRNGRLCLDQTVSADAARPSEQERIEQDAAAYEASRG